MRRAVFLDRDGVLSVSEVQGGRPYAPRRLEDFRIYPYAADAVQRLKDLGFLAIVVTNQRDVSDGLIDESELDRMHVALKAEVPVDAVYQCLCNDECPCYKPRPGMLLTAAEEWGVDLSASYMVGDRWRDVDAGVNAGCRTIFIDRGYSERLRSAPDLRAQDLREAAALIAGERHYGRR